jgi:hypothetical protein
MVASSRPGAVSRFLNWTDGLPGHGWWVFPALAVLLFAYAHAIVWVTGRVPFGVIEPTISVGVAYGPFLLALLAAANFVSKRSLVLWPAQVDEADRLTGRRLRQHTRGLGSGIGVPLAIEVLSRADVPFGVGAGHSSCSSPTFRPCLGYAMAPAAFVHTALRCRPHPPRDHQDRSVRSRPASARADRLTGLHTCSWATL